jgi:hypothetical protein
VPRAAVRDGLGLPLRRVALREREPRNVRLRLASLFLLCLAPSCHAIFPYTGGQRDAARDRTAALDGPRGEGPAEAGFQDGGGAGGRKDAARLDGKSKPDASASDGKKPDASKLDGKKPDASKLDGKGKLDAGACGVWSAWTCTASTTVCMGSCMCRAQCGATYPLLVCSAFSGGVVHCEIDDGVTVKTCTDIPLTGTAGCPVCETAFDQCY